MTTAIAPSSPQAILTGDEFARRYGGEYVELVDGHVQELPVPHPRHGIVCNWAAYYVTQHVILNDLGRVMTNDSFVKTESNPDRVR